MRLWLLSLVAGVTLGVAGTPLGKVSTGRKQAEEEKAGQDKLKKTKRDFFIIGGYSGITETTSSKNEVAKTSLICNGSCTESKMHHLDSSEKEKGEGKGQRELDPYKESLGTLDLQRTILLQLLNQTKAMNRSSEMDFTLQNLNGSSIRDLCEGCCEEREKEEPNLSRKLSMTLKSPRKRRPGQWTLLRGVALPLENSSINMVIMFHNGTHIGYQDKKVTHQAENLREGWCSGCCEDSETVVVLERREGEEVREVPPITTDHGGQVLGNSGSTEMRFAHLSEVSHEAGGQFDLS
ncbi:uncharacterized protein LOC110201950 isoform X2 [Phascolarctos cinereus]|uniref:Uncharacterized protein LOC110201950 isoform X2 n=1 Tax=Phascolarctos cinereus TaxID=38626 RepID=A0A6P5JQI5_PHACI|nr:uncharacterized protein LOC110201950 isoform X2 [Phascolarctos cinereus]